MQGAPLHWVGLAGPEVVTAMLCRAAELTTNCVEPKNPPRRAVIVVTPLAIGCAIPVTGFTVATNVFDELQVALPTMELCARGWPTAVKNPVFALNC